MNLIILIVVIFYLIIAVAYIIYLRSRFKVIIELISQMSYQNPITKFEMSQDGCYFRVNSLSEDNIQLEFLGKNQYHLCMI